MIEHGGDLIHDLPTWGAPEGDVWRGPSSVGEARAQYAQIIAAVDPASGLAGRDAIGVAVLGVTPSGLGVIKRLKGVRGPDKYGNIRQCAQIIRDAGATTLYVEENKAGLFADTLESMLVMMEANVGVHKITTGNMQKGKRIIESLAPVMAAGRLIMPKEIARSDDGGEFVHQMVRVAYDGSTGKKNDADDIVDALAHAVNAVGGSLVGDRGSNIGEHRASQLENWRGISLRRGGLGEHADSVGLQNRKAQGMRFVDGQSGKVDDTDGIPFAERLLAEDETVLRYQAQLDTLKATIAADIQTGRGPDGKMLARIKWLKTTIAQIQETNVL